MKHFNQASSTLFCTNGGTTGSFLHVTKMPHSRRIIDRDQSFSVELSSLVFDVLSRQTKIKHIEVLAVFDLNLHSPF